MQIVVNVVRGEKPVSVKRTTKRKTRTTNIMKNRKIDEKFDNR